MEGFSIARKYCYHVVEVVPDLDGERRPQGRGRLRVWGRILAILAVVVFPYLFNNLAYATPPPQDNTSYFGDCNGDFILTGSDVNCARDQVLGNNVDYSAVVPGTAAKGDTSDITGDGLILGNDRSALRDVVLGLTYTLPDLPWNLDTSGIPASVNLQGPIQVAVTNSSGIGRPGIVVRFTVVGPATLSGRDYNPTDDGIRDHASLPGATQVLAITTTDFPANTTGATELTIPTSSHL